MRYARMDKAGIQASSIQACSTQKLCDWAARVVLLGVAVGFDLAEAGKARRCRNP